MTNREDGANDASREFLTRPEAAEYLFDHFGFGSVSLLEQLAREGKGPDYYRIGSRTLYEPVDLNRWAFSAKRGR